MWPVALCLTAAAFGQAPTRLTVTAATSSQIELAWTGSSGTYTVQRAPVGAAFVNIATVSTAGYTDKTFDPYLDYTYQVLAGTSDTAASNAVSVGPPPPGLTNAAPPPLFGNAPGNEYGYNISLCLDGNGDPAFVFLWENPADNCDFSQTELLFRSWNRAKMAWNPVVKIAATGDITSADAASTSLAYDASTGVFAVATNNDKNAVDLYVSADNGLTWTLRRSFGPDSINPSLALDGGNLYLAFEVSGAGLEFVTGQLSAPSGWTILEAPPAPGYDAAFLADSPSLALDSRGNPAIAWFAPRLSDRHNGSAVLETPGRKSGSGSRDPGHNGCPKPERGQACIPWSESPARCGSSQYPVSRRRCIGRRVFPALG